MRAQLLVATLLLGALPLPAASAAEGAELLADNADDVQYVPTLLEQPLPGAPAAAPDFVKGNDLLAFSASETEDDVVLTVKVASMQGTPQGTFAAVHFSWNGKEHRASMGYFTSELSTVDGQGFAYLQVMEAGEWDWVAELADPIVDRNAATISASVPKAYVMDAQKRIPGRGDALEFTQVIADADLMGLGFFDLNLYDAMPDEPSSALLTLAKGDFSQGSVVLSSADRVRVSNGGATTFVFQAELRNVAEAAQDFQVAVEDLPEGWSATVQSPLTVPAKAQKTASILVSVPFAHEHGGFSAFNLSVKSATDPGTSARMRMGILHTPIPQPAGHHPDLYLHARTRDGDIAAPFNALFPFGYGWMNTEADHTDDADFITPNSFDGDEIGWFIPLNPRLLMGLDFDLERLATLTGSVVGGRAEEVSLRADLYYYRDADNGGESLLLAEGEPASIMLDTQSETPFEVTLTPTAESDYVPYAKDTYLYLVVSMARGFADGIGGPLRPRLMVEPFKLSLPLNEYHDKLTGATEAANAVEIVAKGLVEKAGRPGTVFTYDFEVKNLGDDATFVFDLAGNDIEHATLVPSGLVQLARGESRLVTVAVEIPVSANKGQEFEVLLFVHARDDPSKMAVARTKTKATDAPGEAMPDESAQLLAAQARENETPAPGAPLLVVALLCVALLFRRR